MLTGAVLIFYMRIPFSLIPDIRSFCGAVLYLMLFLVCGVVCGVVCDVVCGVVCGVVYTVFWVPNIIR